MSSPFPMPPQLKYVNGTTAQGDDEAEDSSDDLQYEEADSEDELDDLEGYRPLNPLPKADAHLYTTKMLHDKIHEGQINLNPVWQRDIVWDKKKQSHLIDSLFHNYCIPPVVLALTTTEEGFQEWVCVDGKQRLMSIIDFFAGHIPCRDPRTHQSYYYTTSSKQKTRLQLSDKMKNAFANKVLTCVAYEGLEPYQIRDIFQRVQLGVPLKPAERQQALATPYANWIGHLVEDFVKSDDGISAHITWTVKNAADFSNVVIGVFCCDMFNEQPTPHRTAIDRWLARTDPPPKAFVTKVEAMLQTLCTIASNRKYNKAFQVENIQARVSPVEFVFICVAIYILNGSDATLLEKADAVYRLRTGIRDTGIDLRMNAKACAPLWAYVHLLQEDKYAVLPKNVKLKAKPKTSGKVGRSKKRKAPMESDDDADGEYRAKGGRSKR